VVKLAVWPALFRLVRPHHWVKNLLLLVPLMTSHRVADLVAVSNELRAIAAMCFIASAVYIVNDVFDLASDRLHRTKRWRPIASGEVSIRAATILAIALTLAGGLLAASLPRVFLVWTGVYVVVASLYSLRLKRLPIVDVLALAFLYTVRVLLGAAAIAVPPSAWLLLFVLALFLSLALLKRYVELDEAERRNADVGPGRGYRVSDRHGIGWFGAVSGALALLVIVFYVDGSEAATYYSAPAVLWGLVPCLGYWLGLAWLVAWRGNMHADPIVYALRDPISYAVVAAMAGLTYLAL